MTQDKINASYSSISQLYDVVLSTFPNKKDQKKFLTGNSVRSICSEFSSDGGLISSGNRLKYLSMDESVQQIHQVLCSNWRSSFVWPCCVCLADCHILPIGFQPVQTLLTESVLALEIQMIPFTVCFYRTCLASSHVMKTFMYLINQNIRHHACMHICRFVFV